MSSPNPHVRLLLQPPEAQIRLKLQPSLHRHGFPTPRVEDRGCLQRYGRESGLLRHERLSKGPPIAQPNKQEGSRKNERRVRGRPYLRSGLFTLQNVFNTSGKRQQHQKGKGHNKSCHKKANHPPELQGRPFQKVCLQTWDEHAPKQKPSDL